jgi:DNA-binding SARP family transcriptional activator
MPAAGPGARLVAHLALAGGYVDRRRLAAALWPAAVQQRARGNLRSALWRLQRGLPGLLDLTFPQPRLHPGARVDLWDARRTAALLLERSHPMGPAELLAALESGLGLDLLPDWPADALPPGARARFRELRLHAAEALCERLARSGLRSHALRAAQIVLECDPARESALQLAHAVRLGPLGQTRTRPDLPAAPGPAAPVPPAAWPSAWLPVAGGPAARAQP